MITLPEELKNILEKKETVKILGTVDKNGVPHVVLKDSMKLLDDGTLAYAEEFDSSKTSSNMVRSIWFDKPISMNIANGDDSYQITGKPLRCLITGKIFQQFLISERKRDGGGPDIQAVWIIEPLEFKNQSRKARRDEEINKYPLYNTHLDMLKK
ncbi:MAG: pyridoxamine 5'-phosphate oxidase family protein [Candidatus Schekmanbacteria bacterium]|nr:pyridoxamine 5'-phosphate oxidase family protein [Candidatus Schekmanbacteria bacterium]